MGILASDTGSRGAPGTIQSLNTNEGLPYTVSGTQINRNALGFQANANPGDALAFITPPSKPSIYEMVVSLGAAPGGVVSIIFRKATQFHYVYIGCSVGSQSVSIQNVLDQSIGSGSFTQVANSTFTLRVEDDGTNIVVKVNGSTVCSASDSTNGSTAQSGIELFNCPADTRIVSYSYQDASPAISTRSGYLVTP